MKKALQGILNGGILKRYLAAAKIHRNKKCSSSDQSYLEEERKIHFYVRFSCLPFFTYKKSFKSTKDRELESSDNTKWSTLKVIY